MRIIDLDFYADRGGAIFLGYAGEHLSTVLNFHMPAEFSKDNCLYLVNFEKDDGQVLGGSTPQESQTVGEPTADSLIAFRADRDSNIVKYYVPNTVVGATAHTGKFQLSVYGLDATNNNYKLLGYSTQFSYVIDNAINIGTSINFSEDFIAALDDLSSAIANIGDFSELSQEYTDLVDRISAVLSNIEDNYETISNRSDDEIDYDNITASNISEEDKQKYINLYRIKELVVKIKNKISANATNISNLSTKVGSDSFDDSTKINNVVPSNVMDALKKISTALTSLNNDKINKANAIKYTNTSTLNDCVEPGTIYRYTETINGNLNGLATGDYTIIPSYIAGTGKLAQYIFSTTGAIYYRCRTVENGSYVYTTEKLVTRQEFSALNDIVSSMYNNKTTVINETTLAENNRNKLYPTTGAVDDYIKVLSEQGIIGQKDYIVNYSLPAQGSWTQITGGYTLEIDTSLISGYTFTNKTKIDIEPTVELYSTLERSFCTGLYAVTEENEEIITYKFVALNKAPNTPIDVQLKLSEVNYSEE